MENVFWLFIKKNNYFKLGSIFCAAYLNGEFGVKDIYAGVPVIIGSKGVEKVLEIALSEEEKQNFEKSISTVRELFRAAQKIDPNLK